jgi:hypothetical protein
MFVRLLVLLISNVLCCVSISMCCRSLVQIVVQRGEIEQRWNLGPCQCDRAHSMRSNALRFSAMGMIECMPRQPHIPRCPSRHCFNTCIVGILRQLCVIDVTPCDRTRCVQMHNIRSNTHELAIERTPDLAVHFILLINRTFMYFVIFTFGRRL